MTAVDDTIERLLALATCAIEESRPGDALAPAERAAALAEKAYGRVSDKTSECLELLGRAQHYSNQHDDAARTVSEALRIREQVYGPDSPQAVSALLLLGATLLWGSTPRSATAIFKRALTILEKVVADYPAAYERTINYVADQHREALDLVDAPSVFFRRAISEYVKAGIGHCESALRFCLALLAEKSTEESTSQETDPTGRAQQPANAEAQHSHGNAAELFSRGRDDARAGRQRQARAVLCQALSQSFNEAMDDKDELQTNIADEIGQTLMWSDDPAAAEPWFLVAYHRRRHFAGDDDIGTALAVSHLASAYDKQGKLTAGEKAHTRALETFARYGSDAGPVQVYQFASLEWLADNLCLQHRYDEAESLLQQSIDFQNNIKFHAGVSRLMTWDRLKKVYIGQKRFRDVKDLLVVMAEEQERVFGNVDGILGKMLTELVEYCEQLGDTALASATRARLAAISSQ